MIKMPDEIFGQFTTSFLHIVQLTEDKKNES